MGRGTEAVTWGPDDQAWRSLEVVFGDEPEDAAVGADSVVVAKGEVNPCKGILGFKYFGTFFIFLEEQLLLKSFYGILVLPLHYIKVAECEPILKISRFLLQRIQ